MTFAAAEADRRIANLIQIGVVTGVGAGVARVRIGELDTPELPVAQLRAGAASLWWMPGVGEQVVVACPSGDVARGVILAAIFAGNAPSSDPAVPMIDLGGGRMVIAGDLEVRGRIEVRDDVVADEISLVEHRHGGVERGDAKTDEPE